MRHTIALSPRETADVFEADRIGRFLGSDDPRLRFGALQSTASRILRERGIDATHYALVREGLGWTMSVEVRQPVNG